MTAVSAPVVAARALDQALADRDKALVILGPDAIDIGGPLGPASPYSGLIPHPILLGSESTLVTPHLALADIGRFQGSTPAVFEETPGLDVADSGGSLAPGLVPFGGTPSLLLAVGWVIPGMSPADFRGIPRRVAARSKTPAPSFLLGLTRTPKGPVSPAEPR